MLNSKTTAALLIGLLVIFCGCKRTYTEAESTADLNNIKESVRAQWSNPQTVSAKIQNGWIAGFNSPELNSIVAEAMLNNPDLSAARAKVDQADALAKQAGAQLSPTVDLGGQLSGDTAGSSQRPQGAGLSISWEADVWGRMGLEERSAQESANAVRADYEFARQSLAASVARKWFMLCEINLQVKYLQDIVNMLEKMYSIEETRKDVGKVSMMEVHQVHAQLVSARNAVTKAESARQETARSLEILLGRYPADEVKDADRLVATPPEIPAGQPSSMLDRRPDLIAAQDRAAAAFYADKGAELLHLPRFTIQAGGGVTGLGEAIAGLTAGIFAPLYTGGAIEAQIDQATAKQKETVANYAATALEALKEVETALTNEGLFKESEELLTELVTDNLKTYELSKDQYEVGKIDLFEMLSHQTSWIGSEISLLNIKRQRLDNRINLHLALGGNFESSAQ